MLLNEILICPICLQNLELKGKSLVCVGNNGGKHHSFDLSASGYCDLSYRNGGGGDPKDAVVDRTAFLDKGYYCKLSETINSLCYKYLGEDFLLVDAGCGEGYYSENVASKFLNSKVYGVDLSKHAVHRASVRRNLRSGVNSFYSVASIFNIPIKNSAADCVLSMFAPIAEDEFCRLLKPGGFAIIGAAASRHLYGLKDAIYDSVVLNDIRADLPRELSLIEQLNVKYMISIDNQDDIRRLFGMTPYRFRTSEKSLNLLNSLTALDVEVDVDFYVYQKKI
jgi:23S rRNA (guanine745-N1)-methyltransferase